MLPSYVRFYRLIARAKGHATAMLHMNGAFARRPQPQTASFQSELVWTGLSRTDSFCSVLFCSVLFGRGAMRASRPGPADTNQHSAAQTVYSMKVLAFQPSKARIQFHN
jgi:hypothetical protein